jgi:hypothetical protein
MLINFRQGIAREQVSGSFPNQQPNFLQLNGTGVNLLASFANPTILNFAVGQSDVLFQENLPITLAWAGPLASHVHYWLYWDIDQKTGIRTFGTTTVQPTFGAYGPASPVQGQMWYDTVNFVFNVFNGGSWSPRVRVLAGEVNNGTLTQYAVGSQIGNNTQVNSGFILFDDNNNPVKKYQPFNLGEFITTTSPIASQSSRLQNYNLETAVNLATATLPIAQFTAVCYTQAGINQSSYNNTFLGIASSNSPSTPAIGVAVDNFNTGDVKNYLVEGFINNPTWTFGPPGANVFVDAFGNLTTLAPSVVSGGSVQVIGTVVDMQTLYISPQPLVIYG